MFVVSRTQALCSKAIHINGLTFHILDTGLFTVTAVGRNGKDFFRITIN
jgi:hypothetical protein